jgi:hypothetical protein
MAGTNYGLKNGDVLKASIVGNVITVFINDVKKAQVTDDTYKTGNPGIGLFLQCDGGQGIGSNTNFGFASFSARGIGGTNESNEHGNLRPSARRRSCASAAITVIWRTHPASRFFRGRLLRKTCR